MKTILLVILSLALAGCASTDPRDPQVWNPNKPRIYADPSAAH